MRSVRSEFRPLTAAPAVHRRRLARLSAPARRHAGGMALSKPAVRRQAAAQRAEEFGGVLSRALLCDVGVDRHAIAREVAGDRWRVHGHQTIAVHTRPLERPALWWR